MQTVKPRISPGQLQRMVDKAIAAALASRPTRSANLATAAEAFEYWPAIKGLSDRRLKIAVLQAIDECPPAVQREILARGITFTDVPELPSGRWADAGAGDVRISRAPLAALADDDLRTIIKHELAHVLDDHHDEALKAGLLDMDSWDRAHLDAEHERRANTLVAEWGMYRALRASHNYSAYTWLD